MNDNTPHQGIDEFRKLAALIGWPQSHIEKIARSAIQKRFENMYWYAKFETAHRMYSAESRREDFECL